MNRHGFAAMDASNLGALWHLLVYPRLRELPQAQRPEVLRRARAVEFDAIERVAIVAAVVGTAYLLQPLGHDSAVLLRYLLQFVVALGLLGLLVGPILLRRTRRGLDLELTRLYGGARCTSNVLTPAREQARAERRS